MHGSKFHWDGGDTFLRPVLHDVLQLDLETQLAQASRDVDSEGLLTTKQAGNPADSLREIDAFSDSTRRHTSMATTLLLARLTLAATEASMLSE
jgi:hypothetical protein